jgi:hypothetical protein
MVWVSRGGEVNVPGLKHKDWWLDIVKDKNSDNCIRYCK